MQRLEIIEDAAGETNGILLEWEAVRIADSCAQTLLKIYPLTDPMQKLLGGKTECRHTFHGHGWGANLYLLNEARYGILLINTEMYPCLKRACLSLEAVHLSGIGQMQIQ